MLNSANVSAHQSHQLCLPSQIAQTVLAPRSVFSFDATGGLTTCSCCRALTLLARVSTKAPQEPGKGAEPCLELSRAAGLAFTFSRKARVRVWRLALDACLPYQPLSCDAHVSRFSYDLRAFKMCTHIDHIPTCRWAWASSVGSVREASSTLR